MKTTTAYAVLIFLLLSLSKAQPVPTWLRVAIGPGYQSVPEQLMETDSGYVVINRISDTLSGNAWGYAQLVNYRTDGSVRYSVLVRDSSYTSSWFRTVFPYDDNCAYGYLEQDTVNSLGTGEYLAYQFCRVDLLTGSVQPMGDQLVYTDSDSVAVWGGSSSYDPARLYWCGRKDSMGKSYPHVWCTDTSGLLLWSKTYNPFPAAFISSAFNLVCYPDGKVLVWGGGVTNYWDCTTERAVYMLLDADGNYIRSWLAGAGYNPCYAANQDGVVDTLPGGYVALGMRLNYGGYDFASRLDVFDTTGVLVKFYQNNDTICPMAHEFTSHVLPDPATGDLFMYRYSTSMPGCNPDRNFVGIFRINAALDTVRYEYKYRIELGYTPGQILRTRDGGFLVSGWMYIPSLTSNRTFLLKLDGNGCLPPWCGGITLDFDSLLTSAPEVPGTAPVLAIYPNPATETVRFRLANTLQGTGWLEVQSLLSGEVVATLPVSAGTELELPCSTWPSGAYVVRLLKNGEVLGYEKLIIVH